LYLLKHLIVKTIILCFHKFAAIFAEKLRNRDTFAMLMQIWNQNLKKYRFKMVENYSEKGGTNTHPKLFFVVSKTIYLQN